MNESLTLPILSTLAYFDVFDYPLTVDELYHWQHGFDPETRAVILTTTYSEFLTVINDLKEEKRLEHQGGYYFLPGREATVLARQLATVTIEKKLQIARRAIRLIRYLPFVYGVSVCNTLASGTVKEESDIDVFIIVRSGRMWTTRLMITILLSIFRLRRTSRRVANRICLSYYVTQERLSLQDVAIDERDIYKMYWIEQVVPIYDRAETFTAFRVANQWVKKTIPRALETVRLSDRYRVQDGWISRLIRNITEKILGGELGNWLEAQVKNIQRRFMERHPESGTRPFPTSVVIDDTMLKFHENDRRGIFRSEWEKRVLRISNV